MWAIGYTFVIVIILLAFDTIISSADDYVFKVDKVYLDYKHYWNGGVDPLTTQNGLPNRGLGKGLDLGFETSVLQFLFWNNKIHSTTDRYLDSNKEGQFRTVGWEFRFGVRLHDNLDISYYHHSEHVLDHTRNEPFPRGDALELRFYLYNSKPRMDTIIP